MEGKNISPSAEMPEVSGSILPFLACGRRAWIRVSVVNCVTYCIICFWYCTVLSVSGCIQLNNVAIMLQAIPSSEEERCAKRGVGSSIERQVGSLPESAAEMLGPTPRRVGGDNGARPEPELAPAAADRRTDWRPSRNCCRDLFEANNKQNDEQDNSNFCILKSSFDFL